MCVLVESLKRPVRELANFTRVHNLRHYQYWNLPVDEWYIHFVYSCEISLLVSYILCLDLNLLCSKTCLLHFWHFPNFLPISYACFYAFWVCIILTMCICNCLSLYKNDHHRNKYNVQEKLQYKSFLNCQNLCQCSKFNS